MSLQKIIIIGSGNVAYHLGLQLQKNELEIVGTYSKTIENSEDFARKLKTKAISNLTSLPQHDLILVCVPDQAISTVIESLPEDSKIAYTSGTISVEELPSTKNIGVFYPLQTFTKNKEIDLKAVPFFIEARNKEFEQELVELANKIGKDATITDSEQRKQLHIAAVFVNNFTNHIAHLAKQHVEKHQLSWENLLPLLNETFSKIQTQDPKEIQTGPARRNDLQVIEKHLEELTGNEKEIYKAITNSILHTYHAEL